MHEGSYLTGLAQREVREMSYARVLLGRNCKECNMKFDQLVSFVEEKGRITIKVWRYKCPFCDALTVKPTEEEIRTEMNK